MIPCIRVRGREVLYPRGHDRLTAISYQVEYPFYVGSSYDASTTNLTYRIETTPSTPLQITVSFLSPITPTSTLRQSIPASYVTVHVQGDVGVNVYMDLNGRWLSGNAGSQISWNYDTLNTQADKAGLPRWQIQRQTELLFSEINDRGEWGTLHFIGPPVCIAEAFPGLTADLYNRVPSTNPEMQPPLGVFLQPKAPRGIQMMMAFVPSGIESPFLLCPNPSRSTTRGIATVRHSPLP